MSEIKKGSLVGKLSEMFRLQDKLNENIGQNWKKNRTRKDFIRAIWAECSELMTSLSWKWWTIPDPRNIHIEVVDVFHFILSYIILDEGGVEKAADGKLTQMFVNGLKIGSTKDVDVERYVSDAQFKYLKNENDEAKRKIFLAEEIAKSFLDLNVEMGIYLFGVLVSETTTFDKFYLLYMGKNILNTIRQEKGYKTGTYTKKIGGMEDNIYLYEVISRVKTTKEIEEKLRKVFQDLEVVAMSE